MVALSFSMTDHEIAFSLYSDLPWTRTPSSKAAYFSRLHGDCPLALSTYQPTYIILPLSLAGLKIVTGRKE